MRGYPISSFLFWELDSEHRDEWDAYKFLESASQRGTHNELAGTAGVQQLTLILDGQQRLTALNIGLRGFYETKRKGAWWNNPNAWTRRRLHLDLLKDPRPNDGEEDGEEGGMRYRFAFRSDESDGGAGAGHYWFRVGRILDAPSTDELEDLIEREQKRLPEDAPGGHIRAFNRNLRRLHEAVWRDDTIWHHTEHEQDYDRVLDIFVRANSGGTPLTKSDLLLSMVTARWQGVNAREEIYGFVDRLNGELLRKNDFSKDFVLKTCLVLCDLPVQYQVKNFSDKNLGLIFERWEGIKASVEAGVGLANRFGLDRDTLLSANALIPVIYYLHALRATLRGTGAFKAKNARAIREWLISAMLNNVFSGASDNVLREAGDKGEARRRREGLPGRGAQPQDRRARSHGGCRRGDGRRGPLPQVRRPPCFPCPHPPVRPQGLGPDGVPPGPRHPALPVHRRAARGSWRAPREVGPIQGAPRPPREPGAAPAARERGEEREELLRVGEDPRPGLQARAPHP